MCLLFLPYREKTGSENSVPSQGHKASCPQTRDLNVGLWMPILQPLPQSAGIWNLEGGGSS